MDFDQAGPLAAAAAVFFAAGFAKGAVGFAFPMIVVSLMSLVLPVQAALGVSILPTLATNAAQALRDGPRAAVRALQRHLPVNLGAVAAILLFAGVASATGERAMAVALGLATLAGGAAQWVMRPFADGPAPLRGVAAGAAGGALGAVVGFATPPILLYFTGLPLSRAEFLRGVGATFLVCSLTMTLAHAGWGALDAAAARAGLAALAPTAAGLLCGARLGRRLDAARFRGACLALVAVCGLAILRRGLV
jgi:uncharacterized membrane protein YfcA